MTAHLVHLCMSAVVLGVSLNADAKPAIEGPRLHGQHRSVQYLPRDGLKVIATQHSNQDRNKIISGLRAVETSQARSNSQGMFRGSNRFGDLDSSRPLVIGRYATKNLRRSKKPVNREPNIASGVYYNVNSLQPIPSGESGSDSSVLFVNPTNRLSLPPDDRDLVESQFNGQDASAPPGSILYSPAIRQETRPVIQTDPLVTPNSKITLSKDLYSPSSTPNPPAIRERSGKVPFVKINSLGSPNPEQPAEGVSLSSPESGKEVQDSLEKKLGVFPPGLNDDNRISPRLQDEIVRSPFLSNPDFFAFSNPVWEIDHLGKITGSPFGFGGSFNEEGTSIGDATFIVPEGFGKGALDFELPKSKSPQETFGLTIDDGQTIRNELRKETGEFIESFTSVDGTSRSETGTLVDTPSGGRVLVLKGFYSYRSPEGYDVRVDYTSDQTGYHAMPTIAKPPPTPAATVADR